MPLLSAWVRLKLGEMGGAPGVLGCGEGVPIAKAGACRGDLGIVAIGSDNVQQPLLGASTDVGST